MSKGDLRSPPGNRLEALAEDRRGQHSIRVNDYLEPMGLTQADLARHLKVTTVRINELVNGKRGVTAETAWLLAQAFETTPQFWLNLQANYDLMCERPTVSIGRLKVVAKRPAAKRASAKR